MDKKSCPHDMKIWGNVTVGSKWQIVIPKEVRDLIWIWPKDNLVVITKGNTVVWFMKNDNIEHLLNYIQHEKTI